MKRSLAVPDRKKPLRINGCLGIIGGGQLARMLIMAASRLGFRSVILEPFTDCPAHEVAGHHIVAPYDDVEALHQLASQCEVVTYEFENISRPAMDILAQKIAVFPHPRALQISQDRLLEKTFLHECGIPTAPFADVDDMDSLKMALAEIGPNAILKTRRFGYDGRGQMRLNQPDEGALAKAFEALGGSGLILEGFVDFISEISVIAARGADGTVVFYDCPENCHRDGILRTSRVPARLPSATLRAAEQATQVVLDAFNYVGVIGMEFFVLPDGALLANEFAPRVHNSGHWTEAACFVSQFEQHIRAITGLPLGSPHRHSDCVMENLIGDDIEQVEGLLAQPDLALHLYGKKLVRSQRKMGHFTRLLPKTETL
ncbi:5-(carboxyamino)imidazole ribonucleotide synthase [Bartonella sp. DGB2]|uniref:5-(carboxyamino)imidazole ribonucleotide synthase n=1 Tax=Bartonella sp. DGB2 TaxID=3388426 RepID=UPI00398FA04F